MATVDDPPAWRPRPTPTVTTTRRLALLAPGAAVWLALAFLTATLAVATWPAPVGATSPQRTVPIDGSTIQAVPATAEVIFDEPVIPAFGQGLVIRDAAGNQVDLGAAYSNDLTHLGAKLPPTLPPGTYTGTYQVQAPNGPLLKGTYSFTVADPNAPAAGSTGATNWWRIAAWLMLGITGLLLLGQLFLVALADPADRVRLQKEAAIASGATLAATVVLLLLAARLG